MRIWIGHLVLIAGLVGGALLPGVDTAPARAQSGEAYALIEAVNQYRAGHGLGALAIHPSLMTAAQLHVEWMAASFTYSHTGAGGSRPPDRAMAAGYPSASVLENVAGGTTLSASEAVGWWSRSGVHNDAMLSAHASHVGAGFAANNDQQLFVLLVGDPDGWGPSRPADAAGGGNSAGDSAGEDEEDAGPVAAPLIRNTPAADGSIVHEVGYGQSAWTLAAIYGVDLMEIVHLNNLGPRGIVHPGDRIIIRLAEGQAPPPTPTPPLTHILREGETAWTVAALYGLTLDELLDLNGITRGTVLYPGDELQIRQIDPAEALAAATDSTPPPEVAAAVITPTLSPAPTLTATVEPASPTPLATVTPAPTVTPLPSATPTFAPLGLVSAPDDGDAGDDDSMVLEGALAVGALGALLLAGGALIALRRGRE